MGCGNCGSGSSGKPSGCKSNGGCSTGGCNRMNVYDWLSTLPLHDGAKPYGVIEVTFNKGSRKDFYRNNTNHLLEKGDWIAVEGVSGFDVGQVSLMGELVKLQLKKYGVEENPTMKRVLRPATEEDITAYQTQKDREAEVMIQSRAIARTLNLEMKVCEVELQADGKKATFFYTADQRVDFRELIKLYANEFRVKVEMRQIGARQESAKVGGIGSCGRELCCSTWLTDFKSVNTTAARYQNLSINQTKLSGQCGRLKCCLNYELDTYMDALRMFPNDAETIKTVQGTATLQKRDIFKNLMWYSYANSNKQYPLTIQRVKEIVLLNKDGVTPEELQAVELEIDTTKSSLKVDVGFVNDVGQLSLKSLERSSNNKKRKANKGQQTQGQGQPQGNKPPAEAGARPQQGNRPQQAGGNKQQGNRPKQGPKPDNRPQQPKQAGAAGTEGATPPPQQGGGNRQNRPNRPQGNRPNRPQGPRENKPAAPTPPPTEA
jgi:cell fate regulator YaaT (PSP1 superfamily)